VRATLVTQADVPNLVDLLSTFLFCQKLLKMCWKERIKFRGIILGKIGVETALVFLEESVA
jgi:hypothetical protein